MTSETITGDDGNRLAVYDFGGNGRQALFTHGAGLCATMLRPLAAALQTTVQARALDLRGHGHSQRPDPLDYSWIAIARDIITAVERLELQAPIGIGHSLGATAMLLAESLAPGTFSFLYCYEPPLLLTSEKESEAGAALVVRARQRRAVFSSRQEAFDHFHDRGALAECSDEALSAYVDDALVEVDREMFRLALDPGDEALIYENAAEEPLIALERVSCPVAVVCGDGGGPGPIFARRVADHLSNVRRETLPGPGHLGPMGMANLVADSVIRSIEWATS